MTQQLRGPKQPERIGRVETREGVKGVWIFTKLHSFMTGYSCWVRKFEPVKNMPEKKT